MIRVRETYARRAMLLGLVANALLWAVEAFAQVKESAGLVEELIGVEPTLGFAGLVIGMMLIYEYLSGRSQREERGEWAKAREKSDAARLHSDKELASSISSLTQAFAKLEARLDAHMARTGTQ